MRLFLMKKEKYFYPVFLLESKYSDFHTWATERLN